MNPPSQNIPSPRAAQTPSHGVSLQDVVINSELRLRRVLKVDPRAESASMHALADLLPRGPSIVLKRLAELAVELCDADSAGISMLEAGNDGKQIFRWQALAGELEGYEGGSTPRDWSPCGECLNAAKPMLYSYPARFFTYFQQVGTPIVEGLVIPLYGDGTPVGTIWIASHTERRKFDAENVRMMTSLGSFVSASLRLSLTRGTRPAGHAEAGRELVWREFVRRIAAGDVSALERLIDETRPLVFGRALRILSFQADAEEITSDVYSQVWRIAARYDPQRAGVLAWLLNIAGSRAMDRLRSRASRERRSERSLCFECSNTVDPETSAVTGETRRHVRQALETLPFEQRRAIELAYFDGYSMTEIASRLGHPLGTVKTRIRSGLTALRRLIAATDIHVPPKPIFWSGVNVSKTSRATANFGTTTLNIAGRAN